MSHALNFHLKDVSDSIVNAARYSGELKRPTACEVCAASNTEGKYPRLVWHHYDYAKPLDLIPLCRSCHMKVHAGSIPEPRTGRVYPKRMVVSRPKPVRPPEFCGPRQGLLLSTLREACMIIKTGRDKSWTFSRASHKAAVMWMKANDVMPCAGRASSGGGDAAVAKARELGLPTHQIGPAAVLRVLKGGAP